MSPLPMRTSKHPLRGFSGLMETEIPALFRIPSSLAALVLNAPQLLQASMVTHLRMSPAGKHGIRQTGGPGRRQEPHVECRGSTCPQKTKPPWAAHPPCPSWQYPVPRQSQSSGRFAGIMQTGAPRRGQLRSRDIKATDLPLDGRRLGCRSLLLRRHGRCANTNLRTHCERQGLLLKCRPLPLAGVHLTFLKRGERHTLPQIWAKDFTQTYQK